MKTRQMFFRSIMSIAMATALTLCATHSFDATSSDDDVSNELENLSTNKPSKDRAAKLDSRTRVGIVQGRAVDRNWRVEIGADYGPVAFGDPYLNTQNLGANIDLHINPHVSLGVHYAKAFNQFTTEGQQQFDNARNNVGLTPQVSYPEQSIMGVLDWYMTYGKINLFDWKVVQFDIYTLAGYGQEQVLTDIGSQSNEQWMNTWTAGGGIGFWLNQHTTARFELRYQNYSDEGGTRSLNLIVGTVGLGVLI